ncbi:MAG: HNH endonuclease [Pseudobdellovibrionaceae bacterium]
MNHNEIHQQLKQLVQTERKITEQILDLINQCQRSRTYAKLGYSSMFEYLHKGLGYSEGAAQRRLSSARLLRELPEIKSDLQNGVLNLTQISMAQTAIRKEEKVQSKKMDLAQKKEILEQLKHKNTFESKAILVEALLSYSPEEKNTISPTKDNQVQITLTLNQDQYKQLQEAQDYLSNKIKSTELKDYLLYLTKKVLQQKSPVNPRASADHTDTVKASIAASAINQTIENGTSSSTNIIAGTININAADPTDLLATAIPAVGVVVKKEIQIENKIPTPTNIPKQRPYINQALKAEVFQTAGFQCQYVSKDNQKRCGATKFLQVEHIQPIALDGASSKDNLRIFCQAHNHLAAIESGLINYFNNLPTKQSSAHGFLPAV